MLQSLYYDYIQSTVHSADNKGKSLCSSSFQGAERGGTQKLQRILEAVQHEPLNQRIFGKS